MRKIENTLIDKNHILILVNVNDKYLLHKDFNLFPKKNFYDNYAECQIYLLRALLKYFPEIKYDEIEKQLINIARIKP